MMNSKDFAFNCGICFKRFNHKKNLRRHILVTHEGKRQECYICKKAFTTKFRLNKHNCEDFKNKSNKCDVCRRNFSNVFSLKRHLKGCKKENSTSHIERKSLEKTLYCKQKHMKMKFN